ncbi:hypothetical protein SEMRO_1344_G264710.1 [Seminavis robusta]|uniref:Uncharacterized protein n=1 Tax=Seminavis robusta TaxID=568900 RepID=A0A9N8EQG3_9STRA|nr:hypothetical protein SEMRO_1344_G264710.1 [Seminavis robusta]|eukprot:Sro1344_g264710.1 n/a (519) ;mRNA; f:15089-16645
MSYSDDGLTIANALTNHQVLAVSDGSLKLGLGTSAFVIEATNNPYRISGANQVPGPILPGDSHRCELAGLFAIVLTIHCVCTHHQISHGSARIACDNQQAIHLFDPEYIPDPNHRHFDLVSAILSYTRLTPIMWDAFHVKGHQDNKSTATQTLSRAAQLNIDMDRKAKQYWRHLFVHNHNPPSFDPASLPIHGEGWQLWQGDQKVINPSVNNLYSIIQDPISQNWWIRHNHIPPHLSTELDWSSSADATARLPLSKQKWALKSASANCGVGTTLVEWGYQQDAQCPRCGELESTAHVFRCRGEGANEIWTKGIHQLQVYLDNNMTNPRLSSLLVDCLSRWRNFQPISPDSFHPSTRELVQQQHLIGWQNLLEGLPTKLWRRIQHDYYSQQAIRRSSRRWIRGLLLKLHHLGYSMWKHRNDVKHKTIRPRHQRARLLLDQEIVTEYIKGTTQLLPGDHGMLRHNLATLIAKPPSFKTAWLLNITTARQRYQRIQQHDDSLCTISENTSLLLQWMRGIPP